VELAAEHELVIEGGLDDLLNGEQPQVLVQPDLLSPVQEALHHGDREVALLPQLLHAVLEELLGERLELAVVGLLEPADRVAVVHAGHFHGRVELRPERQRTCQRLDAPGQLPNVREPPGSSARLEEPELTVRHLACHWISPLSLALSRTTSSRRSPLARSTSATLDSMESGVMKSMMRTLLWTSEPILCTR